MLLFGLGKLVYGMVNSFHLFINTNLLFSSYYPVYQCHRRFVRGSLLGSQYDLPPSLETALYESHRHNVTNKVLQLDGVAHRLSQASAQATTVPA